MNGGALNSGAEPATSAVYSATNGGWNSGTGVFTPTSGNPSLSVTVGDFAHVFVDGVTAPTSATTIIGRVTAVNSTTVTVSTTAKSGTAPTTAGTGISINVGGAWKGPNAAEAFPFAYITNALVNTTGNFPRVNMKNDASYLITTAITHSNNQTRFEGYTTSFADLGRATIDAQANAIVPLTMSGVSQLLASVIVTNNGASGTNAGVVMSGTDQVIFNCVANAIRGHGVSLTGSLIACVECEAYACNGAGTSGSAGFNVSALQVAMIRCISHDNTGSTTHGFTGTLSCVGCIADTNGGHGFLASNASSMYHCDAYNNGADGIRFNSGAQFTVVIDSCNCVSNVVNGINILGGFGLLLNCGFHNNAATTSFSTFPISEIGSVTLGAVPYVDAPNGDFRINLPAAKGAGRGTFTETASSYAGTIGYPDIGAAQHLESAGSGGGSRSRIFTGF